jgi:hypothetical protein
MSRLTLERMRIWFWFAAAANCLSIAYTLYPGFGRNGDRVPIEFFVVVFSFVTLIGLPRVVASGAPAQKIVALCLSAVPSGILVLAVPAFFDFCRG